MGRKNFDIDLDAVRRNISQATNEDLLDRITVYRDGMEPEAIALIEAELGQRGVGDRQIYEHQLRRENAMGAPRGIPMPCAFCDRPAVGHRWRFIRIRILPFPWRLRCCDEHLKHPPKRISAATGRGID